MKKIQYWNWLLLEELLNDEFQQEEKGRMKCNARILGVLVNLENILM